MTWKRAWYVVLVLFCVVAIESQGLLENVARNKTTGHSSTYTEFTPLTSDLAVDGNNSPYVYDGSCSHTVSALVNWWYVDLGRLYIVDFLRITNRAEGRGYRLRRFKILGSIHSFDTRDFNDYVYDFTHNFGLELCAEQIDSVQDGDTVQYTCSHMKARFIYIVKVDNGTDSHDERLTKVLTLCEVEVYPISVTTTPTPVTTTTTPGTTTTTPGTTLTTPDTTTVTTTTTALTTSTTVIKKISPSAIVINPQASNYTTLIIVIVACTVILAVIVIVATVFIIRARKFPAAAGNVDVGLQVYEKPKGKRSYENVRREDPMLNTHTEFANIEEASVEDSVEQNKGPDNRETDYENVEDKTYQRPGSFTVVETTYETLQ